MRIETGASSDTGRFRQRNEDAYLTSPALAVVADGMGGHAGGDVASRLAVAAFAPVADRATLRPEDIAEALQNGNRAIRDEAARDPGKAGMGTTITGLALVDHDESLHWLVFNVGDSRVYRLQDGQLLQLTVDHSKVAELVATGALTEDQAKVHPLRNVVTRSLGTAPAPAADVSLFPAAEGDSFVVCSDGLTNELNDPDIARIAGTAGSATEAAASLVAAAVNAGGRDNVTVVVVRVSADTEH